MANEIQSVLVSTLPADPSRMPSIKLAAACREIYAIRDEVIGRLTTEESLEALRRAQAIERYVRTREHRDDAQRAQRVLELAVGAALGPADDVGGRGRKALHARDGLARRDAHRFRLMAASRAVVEQCLAGGVLSRRLVLDHIDRAAKDNSRYTVGREFCTATDLDSLAGADIATIYADPPWRYSNQGTRGATRKHYLHEAGKNEEEGGMSVEEICALPVRPLAADNAHLHLWTTNAFLFEAKTVLEAWGFEYKSCYIWAKPQIGMGNYWRVAHEFMLLGVRGSLPFADHSLRSWGEFRRGKHSTKPDHIRHLIERASPGPRLELFARRPVPGWICWGNAIERNLFHGEQHVA